MMQLENWVHQNEEAIAANRAWIKENEKGISVNTDLIAKNKAFIEEHQTSIKKNLDSIAANRASVENLQQRIAEVHSWMEENKKGIEANSNFIGENSKIVAKNKAWIEQQIHAIAANTDTAKMLNDRADGMSKQADHDHMLILNLFGMLDQYSKRLDELSAGGAVHAPPTAGAAPAPPQSSKERLDSLEDVLRQPVTLIHNGTNATQAAAVAPHEVKPALVAHKRKHHHRRLRH